MVKKILGYGLLVILVFFVAIVTIPSTISPSVTRELKATPSQVHKALSNIQNFRFWDPKIVSDSTVYYDFYSEDNIQCMQVTDSLSNIIATYKIVKSDLEEVQISVDIRDIDLVIYSFKLNKTDFGTQITWSVDFEINLMMYMLGAESKLEIMFSEGLNSFQETLMNNL